MELSDKAKIEALELKVLEQEDQLANLAKVKETVKSGDFKAVEATVKVDGKTHKLSFPYPKISVEVKGNMIAMDAADIAKDEKLLAEFVKQESGFIVE